MESAFDTTLLSVVISLAIIAITVSFVAVLYKIYKILQSIHRITTKVEGMLHNAQGAVTGAMHSAREQLAAIPGIGFLFQKKRGAENQSHKHHVQERPKATERVFERPIASQSLKPLAVEVRNFSSKNQKYQKRQEYIKPVPRPAVKTSQLASPIFGPISSATPIVKKKIAKRKKL